MEGSISKKRQGRTGQPSGRPSKRPRTSSAPLEGGGSFLTLRSNFLTAPFEERVQFLSWLFESAALSMSDFPGALDASSTTGKTGTEDQQSEYPRARLYGTAATPSGDDAPPLNPRKGRQWKAKEIDLLVKLRKEQKLPWSKIAESFAEQFPGRTQGSIQVYWCTKLKDWH